MRMRNFQTTEDDEPLLKLLTDQQRMLLATRKGPKALAAELGWPMGTIKSRMHRARLALVQLRGISK